MLHFIRSDEKEGNPTVWDFALEGNQLLFGNLPGLGEHWCSYSGEKKEGTAGAGRRARILGSSVEEKKANWL